MLQRSIRILISFLIFPFALSAQSWNLALHGTLHGNIKEMVEYDYYSDGLKTNTPEGITTYKHHADSNYISAHHIWNDTLHSYYKWIYDKQNRLIEEHWEEVYDTFTRKVYIHDDRKTTEYYMDRGTIDTTISIFNDKGLVIQRTRNSHNKRFGYWGNTTDTFEYDKDGNLITSIRDNKELSSKTTVIHRWTKKNHTTIATTARRSYSTKNIIVRDAHDNMIKLKPYIQKPGTRKFIKNEDLGTTKQKYKYDEKGNWIEKTDYLDRKKNSFHKRIITYY